MAVEPSFAARWIDPGATVVLVSSLDAPLDLQAVTHLLVVDDWEHEFAYGGRYAAAPGRSRAGGRRRIGGDTSSPTSSPGTTPGVRMRRSGSW